MLQQTGEEKAVSRLPHALVRDDGGEIFFKCSKVENRPGRHALQYRHAEDFSPLCVCARAVAVMRATLTISHFNSLSNVFPQEG